MERPGVPALLGLRRCGSDLSWGGFRWSVHTQPLRVRASPPARASWPGPPSSGSSGQKDGELCTGTSDWLAGAELRELASAVPFCLQRLLLFTLENPPVFVF